MTSPTTSRRRVLAACAGGALLATALGALVIVLERDRPRRQLEQRGVEVACDEQGLPRWVRFPPGVANDELLGQVSRLESVVSVLAPDCEVSVEGIRRLQELPRLVVLDLSGATSTHEALETVSGLPLLKDLRLARCRWVNDDALRHLRRMTGLESLDLSETAVTDAGLAHVRALPRLHDLRLAGCTGITPTGLAGLSSVAELRSVIVHGVLLSRDERRQLQATLAPTHVLHDPASYSDLQPLLDLAAEATLNQNDDVLVVAVGGEADSPIPYDAPPFGPGSPIPMNVPRRLAGRRSGAPASRVVNPDILSVLQDHPTIERLSITDVPITDQHLGVLQRLPNLEMLHLIGVRVRGEGLAPLRESVNLRHVRIDSPVLGDPAVEHLGLPSLKDLTIDTRTPEDGTGSAPVESGLTDDGLKPLGAARSLTWLRLLHVPLTGSGLAHLSELPQLSHLVLDLPRLDERSLSHVAKLPSLLGLELIAPITDVGARELAAAPRVTSLSLTGAVLTADGVAALSRIPQLKGIGLAGCRLEGESLRLLGESQSLKSISLSNTTYSHAALEELRELRPALEVRVLEEESP